MSCQPLLDVWVFVRRVVVKNEVNVELCLHILIDMLKKSNDLFIAMPRQALTDNAAVKHVDGSKQRRRSVAPIIVRLTLRNARLHRQDRSRAIESLDLRFFVNAEHQRLTRWIHIEADTSRTFLAKLGSVENLNDSKRYGCRRCSC